FNDVIARYGRALNWVLDRQPMTLSVALVTLALTILLYVVIPKGFFPVQDTGLIQAISEAPQSISYKAMAEMQEKWPRQSSKILTSSMSALLSASTAPIRRSIPAAS